MAGDWIKIEHTLPDKPEVIQIADALGIDQDEVVGKLVRFWIWADSQSVNGDALIVTTAFLNRLTNCKGFAEALVSVGWLSGSNGHFSIPHFDRHNTQTAKSRALTKDRMKKSRLRSGYARSVTKPSPEKRRDREEKNTKNPCSPLPSKGTSETYSVEFLAFWEAYPATGRVKQSAAWRQWKKALLTTPGAVLLAAAKEYAASPAGMAPVVPSASSWLSGRRWCDDRAAWHRPAVQPATEPAEDLGDICRRATQ